MFFTFSLIFAVIQRKKFIDYIELRIVEFVHQCISFLWTFVNVKD